MRGKSATTLALEAAILDIVEERAPITVRGVAYALFTRSLIPSMETNHTARVSRIMTAMREDKTLDWRKIVDGSRPSRGTNTWLPPCLVGIEACASSHHWSRELHVLGHTVRLMPPAYVKLSLLKTRRRRASVAFRVPRPYRRGHDRPSVRCLFPALVPSA